MENNAPAISFIIVNFQSRKLLHRCLASIQKLSGIEIEVIIVNHDSESLEPFSTEGLSSQIIHAENNTGFGAGINLGARFARGRYLFFLNPDTEIISESLLPAIQEFNRNPRLGILGARMIDGSGKTQKWIAGKKITPFQLIKNNLGFDCSNKIIGSQSPTEVDWISGGAMIIRRELFEKLKGFDEKFFMYFEDVDLCRRAKNLGFDILYFPSLIVKHLGGQSFSDKKTQKKYYYRSQEYYFQKHFGSLSALLVKWLRIIFH